MNNLYSNALYSNGPHELERMECIPVCARDTYTDAQFPLHKSLARHSKNNFVPPLSSPLHLLRHHNIFKLRLGTILSRPAYHLLIKLSLDHTVPSDAATSPKLP